MEQAFTCVPCLPVIDRRVPRTIRIPNPTVDEASAQICRSRIQAGLPTTMLDAKRHRSVEESLMETFKSLLGFDQPSAQHIKTIIDLGGSPMSTESGVELAEHVAVYLEDKEVNIAPAVDALNRLDPGLGNWVYAQFAAWFDSTPGLISDNGLFSLYDSYRLEEQYGSDVPEDEIREYLIENGSDPTEVDWQLPSNILPAIGGKDLVMGKPAETLSELEQRLRKVGHPLLDALAEHMCVLVKQARDVHEDHRMRWPGEYHIPAYFEPVRLTAEPGTQCAAIVGLWDDIKNDQMQSGEYDAILAADHICEVPEGPVKVYGRRIAKKKILTDGMVLAASLVKVYSALDAALCALQKIGEPNAVCEQPSKP